MLLIDVNELKSHAKDVILQNGAKHRCIDATIISELPKKIIVCCKDCRFRYTKCCITKHLLPDDFYCWQGTRKDEQDE